MPGGMPYHLEKGPYLTVLEAQFNLSADHLRTEANRLIRGDPQDTTDFYKCNAITAFPGAPPPDPKTALRDHIYADWFGFSGNPPTIPQALSNCALLQSFPQQTGYWIGYHGDVEQIVRVTLARAAEVALGVNHTTWPTPGSGPAAQITSGDVRRHWPTEFFWVCGSDRFEGYVTWRCHLPTQTGQVTVVFVTPATKDQVYNDLTGKAKQYPHTTIDASGPAPSRMNALAALFEQVVRLLTRPLDRDAMQGIWLVTHTSHDRKSASSVAPTSSGAIGMPPTLIPPGTSNAAPTSLLVGCGDVNTFVPEFRDGGVTPFGVQC